MANPPIHTVSSEKGWANRKEGSNRSLSTHATKKEAVTAGRERARKDKTEHMIHNLDGTISSRNSYGNDPVRRKG